MGGGEGGGVRNPISVPLYCCILNPLGGELHVRPGKEENNNEELGLYSNNIDTTKEEF